MFYGFGCLEQHQALGWRLQVHPILFSRGILCQQGSMILLEIKTEKGKPEPALSLERPMTLGRTASQLPQKRNHVFLEIRGGDISCGTEAGAGH